MQQNIQDSNSNNCDSNNKIIHVKTFLFHCHTALFQYLGNLICIYSFNYCCFGPTSDTHTSNYTRLLWWKLQKKKKNFMVPFYGWGSTGSRLEPLWGGSLLFTTKFPEIPGTHFINLGRMKGWVNLGATQWFWTQNPWIGNLAP